MAGPARVSRFWLAELAACLLLSANTFVAAESAEHTRHLRFTLTVENPKGEPVKDQHLWFYAPAAQSASQNLQKLDVSSPHRTLVDALGNTIIEVSFDRLAPYQTQVVQVSALVSISGNPDPVSRKSANRFLGPEPFVETEDPELRRLGAQLKRDGEAATSRAIYDWVRNNLADIGFVADDRGARYALRERKGDCTEFAYLAVALARINGIPARLVGGYVLDRDMKVGPNDYHNWAEFYLDGTWRVVDAQKGSFLDQSGHYVAFRIVSSREVNPLGGHYRYVGTAGLNVRTP